MKRFKQYKILSLILAIILCCFFSTIAYSAIYSTMEISGLAYARVVKDVRITDFRLNSSSSATSQYEEFGVNTISTKFNLLDSSSSIIFDVEVTNYGSADVGILQLKGDIPTGLSYEIINYNLEDKLCDDTGKCNQMAVKTFQIKFTGTPGEYELTQELDFRTYHTVTYTDMTRYDSYPTEVIDGGTFQLSFEEDLERVSVLINGVEGPYYDRINKYTSLSFSAVGDIEIKVNPPVAKLVGGKIDEVGSEVCIEDECFYIISNDGSTVTMLAKYNLHVGNSVDENWNEVPLENPTGIQDETAKGYGSIFPFIGITAFSNTGSTYSGSIVEGYVNSYNSYLTTQGATPIEARLITKDELISLGCSEYTFSCDEVPSWVYATSYWSGSSYNTSYVWYVNSNTTFDYTTSSNVSRYGVRPVIELSVDDIYVPPVAEVVSGNYDTVGSEVAIGDEHFYVISSTNDTVTMLAKYNLLIGDKYDGTNGAVALSNPTGIQDATAKGWFAGYSVSNPIIGSKQFSPSTYWSSTVGTYPSYVYSQNSYLYEYIENYKNHLESLGVEMSEARVITLEELENLGCKSSSNSCSKAPSWVYSTTYWSGSAYSSSDIWVVFADFSFNYRVYNSYGYGIRPVITISKSNF